LLRRAFEISLREDQVYCAAKASSNLAILLARKGELKEADSFIGFTRKIYRTIDKPDSESLLGTGEALLDMEKGDFCRAIDRLAVILNRPDEKVYDLSTMTASLLLAEILLRTGEYRAAAVKLDQIETRCPLAGLLPPRRMGIFYMRSVAASGMDDKESEARYHAKAEMIRRDIRFAPFERLSTIQGPGLSRKRYFNLRAKAGKIGNSKIERKPQEDKILKVELSGGEGDAGAEFITGDSYLKALVNEIKGVSKSDFPVLLRGETGTGKDLIARMIHRWSERREGPFVPVNMAGMPEHLSDSIMFGHNRGSFTGAVSNRMGLIESAGNGTIFLDEIGDMGKLLQVKLLRYLETGEYYRLGESVPRKGAARLVTATNRDLGEAVETGGFRKDFYHRVGVLEFEIPSLSRRKGDIGLLARYFLAELRKTQGLEGIRFGEEALEVLRSYPWPGNVRELKNEITRVSLRASPPEVKVSDLSAAVISAGTGMAANREGGLRGFLAKVEKREIAEAMAAARGNRSLAARILGIERTTLIYRLKKLGLERL